MRGHQLISAGPELFAERDEIIRQLQSKVNLLETELDRCLMDVERARVYAAIVENSEDAIIYKDLTGIIKAWNVGAERLFGYSAKEAVGKPITIIIPPNLQYEELSILSRIREGKGVDLYETTRQRKDGTLLDISLRISPVRDNEGKIIGASKIARDISARKLSELKLAETLERERVAREGAEASSRAKDDFLAMLSHELRTPLNPVMLIASDSVENHELPPAVRAHFDTILKNIEVQAHLIDDLLDLTRVVHGKINLQMQIVDAHAVLLECIETIQSKIKEKKIQTVLELNAKEHQISADSIRLKQIFWNVLKNAVKFTPEEGKITIETCTTSEARLVVKITDSGIGMSPEELDRIFSAFAQGENSLQYGGLGLGLAISKRLVELHSGHIRATSGGHDCGSTFFIEFPLTK